MLLMGYNNPMMNTQHGLTNDVATITQGVGRCVGAFTVKCHFPTKMGINIYIM